MTVVILNVPFAEKEQAKLLGARWDHELKKWYVPDGMLADPFECWMPDGRPGGLRQPVLSSSARRADSPNKARAAKNRVDEYVGKTVTGSGYIVLTHNCNPFEVCEVCKPILDASGWNSRQIEVRKAAAACVL